MTLSPTVKDGLLYTRLSVEFILPSEGASRDYLLNISIEWLALRVRNLTLLLQLAGGFFRTRRWFFRFRQEAFSNLVVDVAASEVKIPVYLQKR